MSSTNNKTIGVKVTAVLSRTIYIEVPEGSSDEDIINKAKDLIEFCIKNVDILKQRSIKKI